MLVAMTFSMWYVLIVLYVEVVLRWKSSLCRLILITVNLLQTIYYMAEPYKTLSTR